MKPITRTLSWLAALLLATTSCNDFLDRSPQGLFTEDDHPNALVDGKIYNVYTLMRNFNITAGTPAFAIHCFRSEDSQKGSSVSDGADIAQMYDDFVYTPTNGLLSAYWSQNYAVIFQCNDILATLAATQSAGTLTNNDLRNRGEAQLFRSLCYFNLVRAFGEVPLVLNKVVEAADANLPKSPVKALYQQIDADLRSAESLLPRQWSPDFRGRLTWGAARALHARTYLMRNSWDSVYTAARDVMQSAQYNLQTPYNEIFTDRGENSSESVLELQCTATAAKPQSDQIGSQWAEVQGVRGAGQWDLGWGWHMATPLMYAAFEPGDPRRDATLLYFRQRDTDPITPAVTNAPYGESPVSQAMGFAFNKKAYTDPSQRRAFTNKGFWVNIRLIRYADVVLMAAEAANELGNTAEANADLELVRARARGSLVGVLPRVTSMDVAALRQAIRHERRVELGLEPDRFYDLVRWGTATQVLHAAGKVNYQLRNALLPLPQSEIDKSKGVLVQNADY